MHFHEFHAIRAKRVLTCSQAIRLVQKQWPPSTPRQQRVPFLRCPPLMLRKIYRRCCKWPAWLCGSIPKDSRDEPESESHTCPPMQDSMPNEDTILKACFGMLDAPVSGEIGPSNMALDIHTPMLFQIPGHLSQQNSGPTSWCEFGGGLAPVASGPVQLWYIVRGLSHFDALITSHKRTFRRPLVVVTTWGKAQPKWT